MKLCYNAVKEAKCVTVEPSTFLQKFDHIYMNVSFTTLENSSQRHIWILSLANLLGHTIGSVCLLTIFLGKMVS